MENRIWEKKILDWTQYGEKRFRGRPKMRREDEIVKYAGRLWQRTAKDRIRWERLGEAYAQRWVNML